MKKLFSLLAAVFWMGCAMVGVRNTKEPGYTVISVNGDIEIRQYDSLILAETPINGDYAAAGSQGFKRLAGFIFGGNAAKQQIAMTAPVSRQTQGSENLMTFVMPTDYSLSNLPKPLDNRIAIRTIPAKKVAVLRYSGELNPARIAEKTGLLQQWLTEQGILPLSEPRSAAYDPPWTLAALRRNEIHIDIPN